MLPAYPPRHRHARRCSPCCRARLSARADRHRGRAARTRQAASLIVRKGDGGRLGPDRPGFRQGRVLPPPPSATSAADPNDATKTIDAPYNAVGRLEPRADLDQTLVDRVTGDTEALRKADGRRHIPADAMTTSGSGLDPESRRPTPAAGRPRRQGARPPATRCAALVDDNTQAPFFGFIGQPHVNVLMINWRWTTLIAGQARSWRMALDELERARPDPDALLALAARRGAASSRSSSAWRPGSARPTRCCRAPAPQGRGRRRRRRRRRDPRPHRDRGAARRPRGPAAPHDRLSRPRSEEFDIDAALARRPG